MRGDKENEPYNLISIILVFLLVFLTLKLAIEGILA